MKKTPDLPMSELNYMWAYFFSTQISQNIYS